MNILPTKRWHVRNRDNKERVRKDEENARLELQREKERIALAETEARLSILRKNKSGSTEIDVRKPPKEEHINLFLSEEASGEVLRKKDNEEYVKEKQAEKESYEKKIGLLTYLGQSSGEAKKSDERPWYLKKQTRESEKAKLDKKEEGTSDEEEKEANKKFRLDPMSTVDKVLKVKKDKKKKKKKRKMEEKSSGSSSSSSSKSMEQLRKERMQREKAERERSELLLSGKPKRSEESIIAADRNRYNSQFNPHLARHKYDEHKWKPY